MSQTSQMNNLVLTQLLLSCDAAQVDKSANKLSGFVFQILNGHSDEVIKEIATEAFHGIDTTSQDVIVAIQNKIESTFATEDTFDVALVFAVALLQTFIQNNYTGPCSSFSNKELLFDCKDYELLNKQLLQSLAILGQPPYELVDNVEYLVVSLLIFEHITKQPTLFINNTINANENIEELLPVIDANSTPTWLALAHWWRARAILAQLSLINEPTGNQPIIASSILSNIEIAHAITRGLSQDATVGEAFKKQVYVLYYLENVKCSLAINTEHLCLPSLTKVKKFTNFQFVLTGARAKRTKFQEKGHAGLIILAKSQLDDTELDENVVTGSDNFEMPESFALNSDLLLEKPHFESIGAEPLDEQIVKKQKLDENTGVDDNKLLPLALRQEYIPQELQELDPNEQPTLSNLDMIQLLLRLYTIKQTTPAKDPLVEQELSALLGRIIYQNGSKNWSIFSRSLWERSVVETTKAKTIERGLLQMQSLVEELGLKISSRLIPSQRDGTTEESPVARMKYIHQLPFFPRWELDSTLAEKYMSIGVLKSAVEIYERLHMFNEAALCYAAVGDEKEAEKILLKRVETNDQDARAWSILGDIRQDPTLWEKSWNMGRYVNAKNSLARYYYNPPVISGLTRDYNLVLTHLNESLRQYSLNFETWYFYGCVALECERMNVASEAFSRCVSLDPNHSMSWSNLSAAYIQQDKLKEAFSCLKRAVQSDAQKNWRIWENYLIVSVRLNEWDDVLLACKQLVNIRRDKEGEGSIDLPVVEKLVELLVSTDYPREEDDTTDLTFFQRSCIEFICVTIPSVVTTSARTWRLVARVELWRRRPWASLECHEKAYRAVSHNPDLEIDENIWNETVDACDDLVAAYESLGEMEGRYGNGSLVCKDWKYKARSTIKALMSKGKNNWEDSDGWERLMDARRQL